MIKIITSIFFSVWPYLLRSFCKGHQLQKKRQRIGLGTWPSRNLTVASPSLHEHSRALHSCYFEIIGVHTRVNIQIVLLDPSSLLCGDQQGPLWRCGWQKNLSLTVSQIPCQRWACSLVGIGKHQWIASTLLGGHWLRCDSLPLPGEPWLVSEASENSQGCK